MTDSNGLFCPITKDCCRDDCAWVDIRYEMDDDGIKRSTCCAVVGMYATMLVAFTDDTYEGE